jgi:hypothetical protein
VANGSSRGSDGNTFSPNFSATGYSSGAGNVRSSSSTSNAAFDVASLPSSGHKSGFGGGSSYGLHGGEGSDGGRSRRNVSFSGQEHVQQFHKDDIMSSERRNHHHHQQQQQQQQQNIHTFVVPEPPPRKR